jgi:hypothetical protein
MEANEPEGVKLGDRLPPVARSLVWMPGPVNGYDPVARDLVEVGDRYIVLVHVVARKNQVTKDYWDMHIITATECGWDDADGDTWSAWGWSDVSWFCEIGKQMLPELGESLCSR